MSTCDRVLALMLEAEPSELAGRGESEVADHVRACGSCAEAGRRILEVNRGLSFRLDAAPPIDAVALVRRALDDPAARAAPEGETPRARHEAGASSYGGSAGNAARGTPSSETHLGRNPAGDERRRGLRGPAPSVWQGLALAASIAALVVLFGDETPRHVPLAPMPRPTTPSTPTVEAGVGTNVAMFATDNPDITVLWFF